ncbi:CBO0543 family protein [Anaeroselena agilis]|uniref:CBO0543 family protein n=1 Tax=Anaeroselena agilis TaxID=3063788 RepID=A0ABU3NXK8_9FIRM|nr:CBO0543 family protein [Selenomonadales bacterium 4137-cl]
MAFTEQIITITSAAIALLLLIFAVDWRYFRDWVVVFLFKCTVDFLWGSAVVSLKLIEYPDRLFPRYYDTSILFEIWVFPVLCILYNQLTRTRGLTAAVGYALLFSAGITALEYPLEYYTNLIEYKNWTWFTSFYTITATFLISRAFIAFYRWGCDRFTPRRY